MENIFKVRAAVRKEQKRIRQGEMAQAYLQIIYKNLFRSGLRLPQVAEFMNGISEYSHLQNKILVSRSTSDLALDDNTGQLIVAIDDSLTIEDKLFKPDLRINVKKDEEKHLLSLRINSNYPVPNGDWLKQEAIGQNLEDFSRFEGRDVFRTAVVLARCGEYLEQYQDKLMTRAQFKQSSQQA